MSIPALEFDHFDPAVRPADDLYRHVNGRWLAAAVIPDDRPATGAFRKLRDASQAAVRRIVESLAPGDDERGKIAALYGAFMDTDRIERLAGDPLRPLLARVDRIATPADLLAHLGWAARLGLGSAFSIGHDADPAEPTRHKAFLGQGGIGLPDEEYYRAPQHASTCEAYLAHIETVLSLAGVADAEAQSRAAHKLETEIAEHHWDKVRTRDMLQMHNPKTWEEFAELSPGLDWSGFLAAAELPQAVVAEVIVAQPSFFEGLGELISPDRLPAWRAWARWQLVSGLSPFLSSAFVDARFDFYGRVLTGTPSIEDRWKRGINLTEGVLGEAIGKIYVERHFPASSKQRMDELVANLLAAYAESISKLDWMGEATRAEALAKLERFRPKIGYPADWRDYSKLRLVEDDLIASVLAANSFEFDYMIEKLGEPVDLEEWFMLPQTVNAYYHPLRNEIVFPAAILQPPFFNPDADDAVNYGGIGAVIGHEIGHGFDDQGSTCDGEGRLRDWWTPADREAFENRTAALVDQYGQLSPDQADGQFVNGRLTIGENIGDLGGLAIAYDAWLLAGGDPAGEPIDGHTPAQRLFLGWAQVWQQKARDEFVRHLLAIDPHSPAEFRCNQTVRNIDAFHEAFATEPGDELWLDPAERVQIW